MTIYPGQIFDYTYTGTDPGTYMRVRSVDGDRVSWQWLGTGENGSITQAGIKDIHNAVERGWWTERVTCEDLIDLYYENRNT